MPSLRNRSYEKELLDRSDIPFDDIKRNMQELDFINTTLGGHQISIAGLKKLTGTRNNNTIHIAEIGCGGGDNLRALRKWTEKKGIHGSFTGIDINPECIAFAATVKENKGIKFTCSDYRDVKFEERPDIIFSSLFCHHFNEEELVFMLRWMKENCKTGFFINDLQRHAIAYHSIHLLTKLFSKSYLVKNDAPLSVRRGFIKSEWEQIFRLAGIENYQLHWRWAFRWLIIYRKDAIE